MIKFFLADKNKSSSNEKLKFHILAEKTKLVLNRNGTVWEMTEDDYDALCMVLADPRIMQHYPSAFDEAGVRNWIRRNRERYRILGFGLWAVCLKDTGEMIGDCV